jgi:hypothetical protein
MSTKLEEHSELDTQKLVVDELRAVLNGVISTSTIMSATLHGMLFLKKFTNLSGSQKKAILINSLKVLVDQSCMSAEDANTANLILSLAVPEAIDSIVSAANGEIKLKLKNYSCFPCFS